MQNFLRLAKYALGRGILIVVTVVIGAYLTVVIATMGGHMDVLRRAMIREEVGMMLLGDEELRRQPMAERDKRIAEEIAVRERHAGLDEPWILRSFRYLTNAITLNLGRTERMFSLTGSSLVRLNILERLPATLLLMLTANLILFFSALFTALVLSRRYGSLLDRAVVALAPTSAPPAWFYGIFLILIFASWLRILPFGGMVSAVGLETTLDRFLSHLKHLVLPVSAVFLGAIAASVYTWRTFFLIHSSEDYVEMAKAKGLSPRAIERKYVLRPSLPPIITSFGLMMIGLWMGAIVLETVFAWPGIGMLMFDAVGHPPEVGVVVGTGVIYAYLLGMTVFLLDIAYAALDPRVKLGAGGRRPA